MIFGWMIGGFALAYAGMVVLGAYLARELHKRREAYTL